MAVLISTFYSALLTRISGTLSRLPGHPSNFSDHSRRTYQPAAVDWRSKALDKYNEADKSTLKRRECWIMKMGPEDDDGQDVVKCTDKLAPSLRQLTQHGRNGTEFGKADRYHTPVFYTGYTAAGMVAGGAPAGVNPSAAALWFIKRAFSGYQECEGALVLNQKIYTYSDMARASWYLS
jgi:hypothetical protein